MGGVWDYTMPTELYNYVLHERRFFSTITTTPLKLFSYFLKVLNIWICSAWSNVEIIIEGPSK